MHYQALQGGISSEELPFIKSQGPFTTWSCKTTWKIRSINFLQPQRLYQIFIHSLLPYSPDGKLIKYVR